MTDEELDVINQIKKTYASKILRRLDTLIEPKDEAVDFYDKINVVRKEFDIDCV